MEKHLKAFGVTENDCIKAYIIKTSDYSKLKPFSGNRYGGFESQLEYTTQSEIDKFNKHVNDIKKSMIEFGKERGESCGLFDPREPIIVFEINGEYYIVDGQHRAAAAHALGIPFYILIMTSPYGVYDEELGYKRMDANDVEYATDYFKRMNKELKMGWSRENNLSSDARGDNHLAQFICNICVENPLFKSTTLNRRCRVKVDKFNKKTKKFTSTYVRPNEYFKDYNPSTEEMDSVKKQINEYVNIMTKLSYAFYGNEKIRKGTKKESDFLSSTANCEQLGKAVMWVFERPEMAREYGFYNWDCVFKRIIEQKIEKGKATLTPHSFLRKFGIAIPDGTALY